MSVCGNRQYELVKKLSFTRVSTTPEETKAAGILVEEIQALGAAAVVETFPIPRWEMKTAKLEVLEPEYHEYTVTGYGLCGSTPEEGITADFAYVESCSALSLAYTKGKIVLVNNRVSPEAYRDLYHAGVAGFITFSGSVADHEEVADLEQRFLKESQIAFGKIPGVHLHVNDALALVRSQPAKVRLTVVQDEFERDSRNVITEIPGAEHPEEIICLTAHYDSVLYSSGAYDNASGSAALMDILRHYLENPPKRTMRFIWCGSEEVGLKGAEAYVNAHAEDLDRIQFEINIDLTGAVLGEDHALVMADESVCHLLRQLGEETGFNIRTKTEVAPSDCTPFADKGVPGLTFGRYGADGAGFIHNRHDTLDLISAPYLASTTEFIIKFTDKIVNSYVVPVPRRLPEGMPEQIDKYLQRHLIREAQAEKEAAK